MRLEVLNTGTELLLGSVVNTNLKFIAESLFAVGLRVDRQVCVPDGAPIRDALGEAFQRADIVLITGGLGPTTDDITRDAVAELLDLAFEHDDEIWQQIQQRFARRNLPMSPRNIVQALRPREATVLWNPNGTAPGLYFPPLPIPGEPGKLAPHLFLLPGPPRELIPMVRDHVVPQLQKIVPPSNREMRVFRLAGIGESHVEELVGAELLSLDAELGYCARLGEVDIRLIGLASQIEAAREIVHRRLGKHLVSEDQRSLEEVIVQRLAERGETFAIAESCTGGGIANRITNVPGASAVFVEGFVTYANEAKTRSLNVPALLIEEHGAVSEPVARAMADGARARSGAHFAIATTGIAGPGGGTEAKPVGTVFVALSSAHAPTIVEKLFFPTDRERFKELVSQMALDLLRRNLA